MFFCITLYSLACRFNFGQLGKPILIVTEKGVLVVDISLEEAIEKHALPYRSGEDLNRVIDAIGNSKIVLLGEASHGTSEFYTIRAELSKRLIQDHGFSIIAVESDWPPAYAVNLHIKALGNLEQDSIDVLQAFNRWPTWMWANEEVSDFINWLRLHNAQSAKKTGFYGIDLYSLWESMEEIIQHLSVAGLSGNQLELAKKTLACFDSFDRDPEKYALSAIHPANRCINEVERLLTSFRKDAPLFKDEKEMALSLKMNALVARNAEDYYSAMVRDDALSWNIRDEHMAAAIKEIREFHGSDAKIIIWEHNTHIGDARATDMRRAGMVNVGQLLREQQHQDGIFSIGFGTYTGSVIAARSWGEPFQNMRIPPARLNSWEELLNRTGAYDKILLFDNANYALFDRWIGHRAIGVVYHPEDESRGNYVPSKIAQRYDAFIFINDTKALTPIPVENPIL